jgi:hypothetical protein
MLEGEGVIFLSLPEIFQLAFGRDGKVWSTFQSAFGACKVFGVHVKRFAEEVFGCELPKSHRPGLEKLITDPPTIKELPFQQEPETQSLNKSYRQQNAFGRR